MNTFDGPAICLDRNDINTDEIIPAKYLTEITKTALKPHLLEDLLLNGVAFDNQSAAFAESKVVITRANFGCGSSREHAVWAFEVNGINCIIGESFARIFRQNMFNCGILAIELPKEEIDQLMSMEGKITVSVDMENSTIRAVSDGSAKNEFSCKFDLNPYDRDLVTAGGWLPYADEKY